MTEAFGGDMVGGRPHYRAGLHGISANTMLSSLVVGATLVFLLAGC